MVEHINYESLPPDFLLDRFPSPDRFHELAKDPPDSTLAVSKERYSAMKDDINKALQGTGMKLADSHLAIIIRNMEGYLMLSRELKPNKQL